MVLAQSSKLGLDRLGSGCPASYQLRTSDQQAASIFGRSDSRVLRLRMRWNSRSSARSSSRCSSINRLRRLISGDTVHPLLVMNTVARFGKSTVWLTPNSLSLQFGELMNASRDALDSLAFWLSNS